MSGSPKRRQKFAVVHWFPIEYYPPATNLLNYLAAQEEIALTCYTTHNPKHRKPYENQAVSIIRLGFPSAEKNRLNRLLLFLAFQVVTLARLIATWPKNVLYYEPQSAFPVAVYALLNWKAKLLCHHHEYHDPRQFKRRGMLVARINHSIERFFLFNRCDWISHTNEHRMELFKRDIPKLNPLSLRILPNYPPRAWSEFSPVYDSKESFSLQKKSLRLVYVGSLSTSTTFIEQIVEWVAANDGQVTLDIFCFNSDLSVAELFSQNSSPHIQLHSEGLPYEDIPKVLSQFDVGLILYKATTTNYAFNATNKLFEYLATGLDVWFPTEMLGIHPYKDSSRSPRVIEVDFKDNAAISKAVQNFSPRPAFVSKKYCCEDVFSAIHEVVVDVD